MERAEVLKEAKRLHDLGFAVHWLHAKSKRPVESGWTTGPRKTWAELKTSYKNGMNVGVRLGTPSVVSGKYLAVIDVDVKSTLTHHIAEALDKAQALLEGQDAPMVNSGRGNGSRHYYFLTDKPFKTFNPAQSPERVKVHMPSKAPSKKDRAELDEKEIKAGYRISHAWEISYYSDGRQVVLPPSIHPDSGKPYAWVKRPKACGDFPTLQIETEGVKDSPTALRAEGGRDYTSAVLDDFKYEPVEIEWLDMRDAVKKAIQTGEGVEDRSAYLLTATHALMRAKLSRNEILSVLTEPHHWIASCAYEHAKTKDRARAAYWLWKYTVKRVMEEKDLKKRFQSEIEEEELTDEEAAEQEKEIADERSWQQDLDKTQHGKIKDTLRNVVIILKNEVSESLFKRNLFAFRDTYGADTPWGCKTGDMITDDDVVKIKLWFSKRFRLEPGKDLIQDAMTLIACENAFDPVRDWIDALPEWDGKIRLNTWLKDYFEAEGETEYLAQVFRKWMTAMIMRIYQPGAKFDWMPIFEGPQGAGKSSFGRLLVGDQYFLDWLPNLADKDSALALQGMWGVEMGELASLRKNEIEVVKGFITRTVDKIRPPFGRRWVESPRRCVFFGTTNRETYLRDDSGNRRFKPVKVGALDFKALKRDRDQLFAEAKYYFKAGTELKEGLELTGSAKGFEAKTHQEKMVKDESEIMVEVLRAFIDKEKELSESERFDFNKFTMLSLFDDNGPLGRWKLEQRNKIFAGKALRELGAEKWMSCGRNYWKIGVETLETLNGDPKNEEGLYESW